MDRLIRWLVAPCGLGMVLAASGCQNLKSEVPPRPSYSSAGGPSAPVSFGSEPAPVQAPPANFSGVGPSGAMASPYGAPPATSTGDIPPAGMMQGGAGSMPGGNTVVPPQVQPGMMGSPGAPPSPM